MREHGSPLAGAQTEFRAYQELHFAKAGVNVRWPLCPSKATDLAKLAIQLSFALNDHPSQNAYEVVREPI